MTRDQQEAKHLAASGIKWNLIEQVGVSGTTLVATVILSRILLPEDFGLFGMLAVLTNLATLVVGMGLAYSVIQNKSLTERDLASLFWFNLLVGGLISGLFFLIAPVIAAFYHQPDLVFVTRTLCVVFIIQGASAVPLGILMKRMDFKSLAFSQVSAAVLSYISAIVFAMDNFGYWALVAQVLVSNGILVSFNFLLSRWRPSAEFRASSLAKIKSFSINFITTQFIDFAVTNLDAVLVGKYIGKRELGLMGRASALAMLPVTSFGFILNRTFFPWFSSLQGQLDELQLRYTQAAKALFLVIVPVLMLVAVSSEEIVLLLFGEHWGRAAPLVKLFAIYASFNCFNLFNDSFLTSQGRTDLLIRVNLAEKLVLVGAFLTGLFTFGLIGIIVAKTVTTIVFFFFRVYKTCRLLNLPVWRWFKAQSRITLCLIVALVVAWLVKNFVPIDFFLFRLIIVSGVGGLIFYAGLILLKEPSLVVIKKIIINQLGYGGEKK